MNSFPKVEIHRHLEGCFDVPTLFSIAKKNNIDSPKDYKKFIESVQFPENHMPDFKVFLSKFRNDWYRDFSDIENITYNSVLNFAKESIHFIELRFSPEHFALVNNFDRVDVTKTIINAANDAAREKGFFIKYIITFNRNKQTEKEMLELYKKLLGAGFSDIVGYDLAGDEILNPPEEFVNLFSVIYSDNVGITIHAGEVTDPEQIWKAIDLLHAKRVGHGTTAIRDKRLQEELISRKIYLEQCPVSNYFTGSWKKTPLHPFKQLNKKGVLVTLNSDDPTVQNTTLTDDFIAALQFYDVSLDDLILLNLRSIEGSFVPKEQKQKLKKSYEKSAAEFKKANNI